MPDDGFSRIVFQGILNDESGLGEGRLLKVLSHPSNGVWEYHDYNIRLKPGDMVYYSVHVTKEDQVYVLKNGVFTVTKYKNPDVPPTTPRPRPPYRPPCDVSSTRVEGHQYTCTESLIFNEDFDRNSLDDLTAWTQENQFPDEPDYAFNVYQTDVAMSMKSGSLVITPIALEEIKEVLDFSNRCTDNIGTRQCMQVSSGALVVPPIITGKITTKHSFSFTYGRIEISAKLPTEDWLIPELILEPRYSDYGSENYASGLLRVAYTRGGPSSGKKLQAGPVLSDAEPYRSYFLRETVGEEKWSNSFHNYTMLWTPDGIEMFVDGERFGTVSPGFYASGKEYHVPHAERWQYKNSMTPLDQQFYLSLGLRVGGVNDFPDSPDKPWKNKSSKAILDFWNNRTTWLPSWTNSQLLVDYVRVYAL